LGDRALIGVGRGGGNGALGGGAFVAVGLGEGGGGLDARRAASGRCLGRGGSGRCEPGTGAHLRATRRGQDDDVILIVGPR
jgi:hypothetical protein